VRPTKPSPRAEHDEPIRTELVSVVGLSVHAAAEVLNKRWATTPSGVGRWRPAILDRPEAVGANGSIVIVSQDVGQSPEQAVRRTTPPPASQIAVVKNARRLLVSPATCASGHGG
jgi:hypothetical protein